jgi:GNAT superfamily N-acetyltransferase
MDSKLRIEHLADYPEAIPILKEWFESEWGSYYGPTGPGDAQRDLLADAHRGALPLGIVALDEHELCGVAALRAESIVTHAHLRPWAAAGLVKPCLRRRGIGTALIRALEETARSLGYSHIYCATSTAHHLLQRRGWQCREQVTYHGEEVCIYQKVL